MSKIAILSDVHANLPALEKSIETLSEYNPDRWVCLGDIVGYGPHPSECIKIVRELNMECVLGNHDAGVAGQLSQMHFNYPNRRLIELTRENLNKDEIDWLNNLPLTIEFDDLGVKAAHATPNDPEQWIYLESAVEARRLLEKSKYNILMVGHTHKPALVSGTLGITSFKKGYKYLINPGSIGQSRDGDRRASAGILDLGKVTYKNLRIDYDKKKVLADLIKLGFSRGEAEHLMYVNR